MEWNDLARKAEAGDADAQYELGQLYWRGEKTQRNTKAALEWFRRAAKGGKPDHLKTLGLILCDADFEFGDFKEGFAQMLAAARAGDAAAQYFVAVEYATGERISRDPAVAATWYRRAAEQGHAEAEYNLGIMHLEGDGVTQNLGEGRRLVVSAAERGEYLARKFLWRAYTQGLFGFPIDSQQALHWQKLAESQ